MNQAGHDGFQLRSEVTENRRRVGHPHAPDPISLLEHSQHDLNDVVDMTLGIDPPGEGHANEFACSGLLGAIELKSEHDRADLARSNAPFKIDGRSQ